MTTQPIPDRYHTVTPYLVVPDVVAVLDFVQRAFAAEVAECVKGPDGGVRHAEAVIGDSVVMMGQAGGEWQPKPACLYLYVEDVDAVYARAVAAGGASLREPADQFYGDRSGGVCDPAGNQWWIATHVEDVPPEELARRAAGSEH